MAITKGYSFDTTEQVTAAKLHTLVDSATIDDSAVTVGKIADLAITNAKISASAGIALSKVATTSGKLVGGSASNTAEEVTVGATLTLASSTIGVADGGIGTTQLAANAVTVAKLASTLDLSSNTVTLPDENVGAAKLDQDFIADVSEVAAATGDYLLFGDATDSNNLKKATIGSIVATGIAPTSSATAAVPSTTGSVQYAHGLGRVPSIYFCVLVCTSTDSGTGHTAGDEVPIASVFLKETNTLSDDTELPIMVTADATNLTASFYMSSGQYLMGATKTGGGTAVFTKAKWAVKFYVLY